MLVSKMEKVLATQSGAVSEQVDEISNSILKVEQQIQQILDRSHTIDYRDEQSVRLNV